MGRYAVCLAIFALSAGTALVMSEQGRGARRPQLLDRDASVQIETVKDQVLRAWSGTWSSRISLGIFHGTVQTQFPDPFPPGEEFAATVTLTYAEDSPLFPGQSESIECTGVYDAGREGGSLLLIGSKGEWTVEFEGVPDLDRGVIEGGYRSWSPPDQGSFAVERN